MNPLFPLHIQNIPLSNISYPENYFISQEGNIITRIQSFMPIRYVNVEYETQPLVYPQPTLHSTFVHPETPFDCKTEAFSESHYSETQNKVEESMIIKKEEDDNFNTFGQPEDFDLSIQVEDMLNFFIEKFGKCDDDELNRQRNRYAGNHSLTSLFDNLCEKYLSSAKSREDMIRLVLRKAFASLRDSLRQKYHFNAKTASAELVKRYFGVKNEDCLIIKQETEEEENFDFSAFESNSMNKVLTLNFITKIFSSREFRQDYIQYLSRFDGIFESENQKKTARFRDFLVECIKNNMIHKLKSFTRLPWLKLWLRSMKVVAYELLDSKTWASYYKRRKGKVGKKQKSIPSKIEDSSN